MPSFLLAGLFYLAALSTTAADELDLAIGTPLKGAWLNTAMPGQGFLVEVIEEPPVVFIGWFTFPRTSEGPVTDPVAQRWYTLEGIWDNASTAMDIYETSGGGFLGSNQVFQDIIGSASIRFTSCNNAEISYQFYDSPEQGTVSITRAVSVAESKCDDLLPAIPVPESVQASQVSVITRVNLLDMPSGITRGKQMVIVEDGIITHVGEMDTARIPEGSVVIDGRSRYLLPGMVDTHTHLATNVREFLGLNAPLNLVEESARNQLILYVARGVTSILNNGDFGEPLPRWGEEVVSGQLTGPTVYAAQYSRGPVSSPDGGPPGREVIDADQARVFTRDAQEEGYQFMKVYNYTPREGVLAILDESEKLGMPVVGHFPQTMSTQEALENGMAMVAHTGAYLWRFFGNNTDPPQFQLSQAIQMTQQAGAAVTATVGLEEIVERVFCNDPQGVADYWARVETRFMHPTTVSLNDRSINATWRWDPPGCIHAAYRPVTAFISKFTKDLHDAGVTVLMGTDSPTVLGVPGFSAVDEVQALVNSGIPLVDAIRIATWNGGQFISEQLELDLPFGAIREGWRADMILLGSDPLVSAQNLEDIVGVMARGRWKSDEWFRVQLEAIAQSYGN